MPVPLEICLEDLDLSPEDERYVRCVALPGGEPGLALDREGLVRWMPEEQAAHGLWVSADDRLVLLRDAAAGPVRVIRGERQLEAPAGKPVLLVHGDLLQLNGRRLRVHIHGATEAIYEPEPLSGSALARMARVATAAMALGAALVAGGEAGARSPAAGTADAIEVRARPPAPPRVIRVACTVDRMTVSKSGQVLVHATCPPRRRLSKGAYGQLLDAKGQAIKNGTVIVKQVQGKKGEKIVCETRLKKPVKASSAVFHVR